ncbi:MAG: L,D-transpeptidase family protein [Caulobacteraceae bacterium]
MNFIVNSDGRMDIDGTSVRCRLGRTGVRPWRDKTEGDGATPAGSWPFRGVLFRPDRGGPPPRTRLPMEAVARDDGWCDAPNDPAYNRRVKLPYPTSAELLWRADGLYDLIVVLGYNDRPVVPGKGSAIFLHLAGSGPTEGCVAMERRDLERLLALAAKGDRLVIHPQSKASGED